MIRKDQTQSITRTTALILLGALLITGCTEPTTPPTGQAGYQPPQATNTTAEQLDVGAVIPLSGPTAVYGDGLQRGMELARNQLRDNGINISIMYADSEGEARAGLSAYEKLKRQNVDVVISAMSRVSRPIAERAEQDRIPHIATITSATDLAESGMYNFRLFPKDPQVAETMFKGALQHGVGSVAVLSIKDEYGRSITKEIRKQARDHEVNITTVERYSFADNDVRTQLTKIRESDPEAIFVVAVATPNLQTIFSQAQEMGLNAEMYDFSLLTAFNSTRKQLPEQAEGVHTVAFPLTLRPQAKFNAAFKERYGEPHFWSAPFGYDALQLLGSITDGKATTGLELVEALRAEGAYSGVNGNVSITESGEMNPRMHPVRVVNGSLTKMLETPAVS